MKFSDLSLQNRAIIIAVVHAAIVGGVTAVATFDANNPLVSAALFVLILVTFCGVAVNVASMAFHELRAHFEHERRVQAMYPQYIITPPDSTRPASTPDELAMVASGFLKEDAGQWLKNNGYREPVEADHEGPGEEDPDAYEVAAANLDWDPDLRVRRPEIFDGPNAPGTTEEGPHGARTY